MASGADDAPGTAALALAAVVKGKRTKRQLAPPVAPVAAEPSSSSAAETSPSRSGADEAASGWATEEEEDMALCLMLLAQGRHGRRPEAPVGKEARFRSRRPANGSAGEGGEFVYECKTCNKSFPSFQALGGHRASHKKPRLLPPPPPPPTTPPPAVASDAEEEKPQPTTQPIVSKPAAPINSNNSKQPRLHECSICGSEFPSGQALGGHMRRHRPLVPASVSAQENGSGRGSGGPRKEKSLLELDLNLPAPCDGAADVETSATSPRPEFAFAVATEMALILPPAASALVDCHY